MEKIRVAQFGVSHPHSRAHLRSLQLSSMVSGIVLFDTDPKALEEFRTGMDHKIEGWYTDLDILLEKEELLVGIANFQNDLNVELSIKLIDAGLHVISEKPVGNSVTGVERVVKAAAQASVKLGVMYQNRYHPITQEARRLVLDGVVGQVTSCETRMVTSQVKFRNPKHWLFNKETAGGGILSWLGCHYFDLIQYVMDDEVVSVLAMVETLSGEDIDVEDVASVILKFGSGAIGSLQAGYQLAHSLEGYSSANYDTYIGFRGTDGQVSWNPTDQPPQMQVNSTRKGWQSAPERKISFRIPEMEGYGGVYGLAFLERFLQAARGVGDPPATGEDALKVSRIVAAAYESNLTGRRVDL